MTGQSVALLGASGFIGRHILHELRSRGMHVSELHVPRWRSTARSVSDLVSEAEGLDLSTLTDLLMPNALVINAAGASMATGSDMNSLVGANALLPAALARATPAHTRVVHVSSAAVQGRAAILDESRRYAPFSPYSLSKVLGESVLAVRPGAVCFRPTSVHGWDRSVSRSLHRVLASPLSSVGGCGDAHTPQALVENAAAAIAEVALASRPPQVVLQPSEGLTCRDLAVLLGGKEPLRVPMPVARTMLRVGGTVGSRSALATGLVRRAEMMWLGQDQSVSWLTKRGWVPPVGRDGWVELGRRLAEESRIARHRR